MQLPIDTVPGSNPPRFKWRQTVTTPSGPRTVEHVGVLSLCAETAVMALIGLAKEQDRLVTELKRARTTPPEAIPVTVDAAPKVSSLKKGKGN